MEKSKNYIISNRITIPFKKYKISIKYSKNINQNYKFISNYGNFIFNDFDYKGYKYSIEKGKYKFIYDINSFKTNFKLNNVSELGKFNGKWYLISLGTNNLKINYRKIYSTSYFDITKNNAFFVTSSLDRYFYGKANIDIENYELENDYIKKIIEINLY
ncbi:hypothetical protein EV215_0262 [Hypnocyclicus thermotrophus]|uniref:Uncharacterized protein n=1 Tax=Hypnocyclicus thermotrophus TaxID=1627895 RepID=A0AA46E0F8_9FUSO|nr:hypothetical protein [Hypnocyclicus thermotrophus]TDT72456.1 hypothetical protein EV215_0262 [Hypnocyclicus thermotrophus]